MIHPAVSTALIVSHCCTDPGQPVGVVFLLGWVVKYILNCLGDEEVMCGLCLFTQTRLVCSVS